MDDPQRLRFTSTTPFRATGKSGREYQIVWSKLRDRYILTVDGVNHFSSSHKAESVTEANQIERMSLPAPPEPR